MKSTSSCILAATSVVALAAACSSAIAGSFAIREQSTRAQGLAFAGAASGSGGVSSIFWNPATVTMQPGWNSEFDASFIFPSAEITPVSPTPTAAFGPSGEIGRDALVPSSYTTFQVNESLWLGLATTAPFGLVTKPNTSWSGQVYSRTSKAYSLNFNPIVGIKLTDWLSIGAGPTIQYFQTRLRSAAGVTPTSGTVLLEGDDWAAGYTAGATITPMKGTDIGLGYRSSVHHDVHGSLRTPLGFIPGSVNLNLPDTLTVGVTQAVTDQLKLNFGFEFTNWSRVNAPAFVSDFTGLPVTPVTFAYKDGYFYSVGAEYQWDPRWAFRVGIAYEQSPIDITNRSTRLPDTDRIHAAIGASYKVTEKLSVDASYLHVFRVGSDHDIRLVPGNPSYNGLPFLAKSDISIDDFSIAVRYRWDDPAVAIAAPIVRKY